MHSIIMRHVNGNRENIKIYTMSGISLDLIKKYEQISSVYYQYI